MKIAVLGLGRVGSTLAYTLVLRGLGDTLLLWDRTPGKARGEALDLEHCLSFTSKPQTIIGTHLLEEVRDCDILLISVSTPWKLEYKLRTDLARPNADLLRELVPGLAMANPDAVMVLLTNPVDALVELVWRLTDWEAGRILGMGTLLDSARFRSELSGLYAIHPDDIRAYVLGEHGETQFPALSAAQSGGERIPDTPEVRALLDNARDAGHEIIRGKGYTNYGVAAAASLLVESMLEGANRTMPVSLHLDGWHGISGVALSVPAVVGKGGVVRVLRPELNADEILKLKKSADAVKAIVEEIG